MTESRQNYREITVQDVNITETTEARSPLTFRNLLYVVAYMQSQKMQRKPEKRLYTLMYSSSLKVSCLFIVHLANSCVFAVNTVLKFQNFTFVEKC